MAWPNNPRPARSLVRLREQIDAAYPNRNRASDGMIGDAAHAATISDHNPNAAGVVTALDITHDPANGVDIDKLSDELAATRDPRIKYLIANGLAMEPAVSGWNWVQYYGDPHTNHLHISVYGNYDDDSDWRIFNEGEDMPASQQKVDELTVRLGYNIGMFRQPRDDEIKHWLDSGLNVEQFLRAILISKEHESIGKAASITDFEPLEEPVFVKKKGK